MTPLAGANEAATAAAAAPNVASPPAPAAAMRNFLFPESFFQSTRHLQGETTNTASDGPNGKTPQSHPLQNFLPTSAASAALTSIEISLDLCAAQQIGLVGLAGFDGPHEAFVDAGRGLQLLSFPLCAGGVFAEARVEAVVGAIEIEHERAFGAMNLEPQV